MKIVIAGGTGFLGNELVHHFESDRNEVFVLTRGKSKIIGNINMLIVSIHSFESEECKIEKTHSTQNKN